MYRHTDNAAVACKSTLRGHTLKSHLLAYSIVIFVAGTLVTFSSAALAAPPGGSRTSVERSTVRSDTTSHVAAAAKGLPVRGFPSFDVLGAETRYLAEGASTKPRTSPRPRYESLTEADLADYSEWAHPLIRLRVDQLQCKEFVLIGARGSGENDFRFTGSETWRLYRDAKVGLLGGPVGELFKSMARSTTFRGQIEAYGIRYAALSVPGLTDVAGWRDYMVTAERGRREVIKAAQRIAEKCPTSRLILAGYSQGAWIVGATIRVADSEGMLFRDRVAALVLMADPMGVRSGEHLINPQGDTGWTAWDTYKNVGVAAAWDVLPAVAAARNLVPDLNILAAGGFGEFENRVIHLCMPQDIVCDFQLPLVANMKRIATIHTVAYGGAQYLLQSEDEYQLRFAWKFYNTSVSRLGRFVSVWRLNEFKRSLGSVLGLAI